MDMSVKTLLKAFTVLCYKFEDTKVNKNRCRVNECQKIVAGPYSAYILKNMYELEPTR